MANINSGLSLASGDKFSPLLLLLLLLALHSPSPGRISSLCHYLQLQQPRQSWIEKYVMFAYLQINKIKEDNRIKQKKNEEKNIII